MENRIYQDLPHSLKEVQDQLLQLAIHSSYAGEKRAILIFEDDPPNIFENLQPMVQFIRKKRMIQPWIFNRRFVEESLDSYPLEFLDISSSYENIVSNTDILCRLSFDKADVRLQMERELRSKWLLTRQELLENPYKTASIRNIVNLSRIALYPTLTGLLLLHDKDIPASLEEAIEQVSLLSKINMDALVDIISGMQEAIRYLETLKQMIHYIQRFKL